ncbi:Pectinesterase [Citrus sinensis]|nr:Pectinesterase [Citrus sinensis]
MLLKLFLLALLLERTSSWVASNESNDLAVVEQGYLNWVNFKQHAPHLNHSLFQKAKNKFKPCKTIKVNKNPRLGNFVTVQKAINSLPVINLCRVVIFISAGTYREKVEIPTTMAYITMIGAGADNTVIEWDDTADRMGRSGRPLGTYASATFAVNSPYFIAKNITFKNKAPLPPSGALGKQAVAFRISADTAAFTGCKFIGSQDTLYDHIGRHYFKNCYIEGSKRGSLLEETGFSFVKCKVTGSGALYLGRAWGTFSRVVFAYTYMDKIITPRGWYDWGDKNREMTVFYGQYKCSGPGAYYGGRVSWSRELTQEEAEPFISVEFIDGHQWLPSHSL